MKIRILILPLLIFLVCLLPSLTHAQTTVMPGRSVGRVFLGMARADVQKILGKPTQKFTVPHGSSVYTEDVWLNGHMLNVFCERGTVVQIEFDSSHFTTLDGLSTETGLRQICRTDRSLTVSSYDMRYEADYIGYTVGFYFDDVSRGIAFFYETNGGITAAYRQGWPATILVHRPGHPVLPLYEEHYLNPMPITIQSVRDLRLMRSWLAPSGSRTEG